MKYKENQLILELCKFLDYDRKKIKKLLSEKLDMAYVLGNLMMNRVGGIAYTVLKDSGCIGLVNREFKSTLENVFENNKCRTQSFKESLVHMTKMLENVNFKYVFLKGAYLAYLYPEGCRTSNDIDMLANQTDLDYIDEIMQRNCFSQGYITDNMFVSATRQEKIITRMSRGETIPYIKQIDLPGMKFLEIDVNFSLDFKPEESFVVKNMLDNTNQNILSDTDFLIHLCVHLYKEATTYNWVFMERDMSLYKFCDIYLWINRFVNEKYAELFVSLVKKYNLQKECYYVLYNTQVLFNIENSLLVKIIDEIRPIDCKFMNEIYNPQDKKTMKYEMDFVNWVFCKNRIGELA